MTYLLFGKGKYSSWLPTGAYRDTGERNGFVRSELPAMDGEDVELPLEGGPAIGVASQMVDEADALADLTASSASLAAMQGVYVPTMPISTDAERQKFRDMWLGFLKEGGQSALDFSEFARAWNKSLGSGGQKDKGISDAGHVFRKTAGQLKAYWKK